MQSQSTTPWAIWPFQPFAFPPAAFQPFAAFDNKLLENWQKMMGLNADFSRSIAEETQFDWASCFMPQDPEELYARQWTNQMPMMSIPLHYMNAMLELGAATQRAWMDTWGHWLGLPALLPTMSMMPVMPVMPVMPDVSAAPTAKGDVVDVPAGRVRETPRERKGNSH
ncbi:phasin family protein [Cupriavidus pauculus]|uniref:Phasin domain-containing protein n=1 Tax=Cupriavidus pauculus TaxID=82633 RepID=A0A2N5CEX9_9BURK|nr:phasin family protein [Cupriavidus pauculus]PLQ00742.1 hypothetical protein CYJ10_09855 [Cupriavidus pauculus]